MVQVLHGTVILKVKATLKPCAYHNVCICMHSTSTLWCWWYRWEGWGTPGALGCYWWGIKAILWKKIFLACGDYYSRVWFRFFIWICETIFAITCDFENILICDVNSFSFIGDSVIKHTFVIASKFYILYCEMGLKLKFFMKQDFNLKFINWWFFDWTSITP